MTLAFESLIEYGASTLATACDNDHGGCDSPPCQCQVCDVCQS